MDQVLFSSNKSEWSTPQDLFDKLNQKYLFTLDPAALSHNAKCQHFYTPVENGLLQPWNGNVFCNPPYGRNVTGKWVAKAYQEITTNPECELIVMLLPSRTDTKWFHEYIWNKCNELQFIKGRLKFSNCKDPAPFPSMLVTYKRIGYNLSATY